MREALELPKLSNKLSLKESGAASEAIKSFQRQSEKFFFFLSLLTSLINKNNHI